MPKTAQKRTKSLISWVPDSHPSGEDTAWHFGTTEEDCLSGNWASSQGSPRRKRICCGRQRKMSASSGTMDRWKSMRRPQCRWGKFNDLVSAKNGLVSRMREGWLNLNSVQIFIFWFPCWELWMRYNDNEPGLFCFIYFCILENILIF